MKVLHFVHANYLRELKCLLVANNFEQVNVPLEERLWIVL